MIFNYLVKIKRVHNRINRWLFDEWLQAWSLNEYDVERFKFTTIIRRLQTWFKPYKVSDRHFIGQLEEVEYTRVGAVYHLLKELKFHIIREYAAKTLRLQPIFNSLINHPSFLEMQGFYRMYLMCYSDTVSWLTSEGEARNIYFRNFLSPRSKANVLNSHKSWIHHDMTYRDIPIFYSVIILDSFKVLCNFLNEKIFDFSNKVVYFISKLVFYLFLIFLFVVFVSMLFIFYTFMYTNLFTNMFMYIILIFFFYFFCNLYFHFSKTYRVNKYTSANQRFWKRTFGVFWGLEFTLFTIYMYLMLVSPAELATEAINRKEIIKGLEIFNTSSYHIFYLFVLVTINFLYINLIFFKKKNNMQITKPILFLLNFLYFFILYYEFLKLYYVAGWGTHTIHSSVKSFANDFEYNNMPLTLEQPTLSLWSDQFYYHRPTFSFKKNVIWKPAKEVILTHTSDYFKVPNSVLSSWNEVSCEKQWVRTFRHFIYITILLKFWHVLFIYIYFTFTLVKFLETNYLSFDSVSSNQQNVLYLTWFYIFSYILIVKKKIYFLLTAVYYSFFVSLNYLNFFQSLINEFNYYYFIYV